MKHNPLETTSQVLTIISQIGLIGIEAGFIAGGYFLYKKITAEDKLVQEVVEVPEGMQLVPVKEKKKQTWKQKWSKIRKIAKAVIEG